MALMIIVGLTGEIESGKTTFAEFLAEQLNAAEHWESWQLIAEVAEQLRSESDDYPKPDDLAAINKWLKPLPAIVESVAHRTIDDSAVHVTREKVNKHPDHFEKLFLHLVQASQNPGLQSERITVDSKEQFRPLLQWLGGFLIVQSDDGLWYDEILRRIAARAELELATIGGVRFPGESIRIQAAGGQVLRIVRPDKEQRDAADLTERQNKLIPVTATIVNNGTLTQLKACAAQVMKDLKAKQLAMEYAAATF